MSALDAMIDAMAQRRYYSVHPGGSKARKWESLSADHRAIYEMAADQDLQAALAVRIPSGERAIVAALVEMGVLEREIDKMKSGWTDEPNGTYVDDEGETHTAYVSRITKPAYRYRACTDQHNDLGGSET